MTVADSIAHLVEALPQIITALGLIATALASLVSALISIRNRRAMDEVNRRTETLHATVDGQLSRFRQDVIEGAGRLLKETDRAGRLEGRRLAEPEIVSLREELARERTRADQAETTAAANARRIDEIQRQLAAEPRPVVVTNPADNPVPIHFDVHVKDEPDPERPKS